MPPGHSGSVTTSPAPANLRDLRGLRTDDGRIVRRGVLYRSEALRSRDIGADDVAIWPPTTVIDLRAAAEYFAPHPLDVEGTVVHSIPLGTSLAPALAGPDRPGFAVAYRHLAKDASEEIARIVGIVARADGPVLVHCTAGKDRTGIVVAVLLRAVGVRRDDVLADYLRTEANLPRLWAALNAAGVPSPRNAALLGVQADALEGVLDEIDATEGGAAGWLVEHGADPADIAQLATRLLSDAYPPAV